MKTRLTVFTPTYNRAYILPRLYDSIKRQTSKEFKWLIIDDGSTDGTDQLVEKWKNEGVIIIEYYWQENRGMHAAHNTAYSLIDTELNVCIDSDDYLDINAIKMILAFWGKCGSSDIGGIVALNADTEGKIIGTRLTETIGKSTLHDIYCKYKCKGDKKIIYRSDLTKMYPYPLFDNEKFVPLGYKYHKIDEEYELLILNEIICYVEYLKDGSTLNMFSQYYKNPKGFAFARLEKLKSPIGSIPYKFRQAIHYVSSCFFMKDINVFRNNPCKILTLFALPIGITWNIYCRFKLRKQDYAQF